MSVLVRTAYYTVPLGVFTAGLYYWVKSDKTQARIKQNVVYHKPGGADPELIERNKRLIENITAITKGNHVIIDVMLTIATIVSLQAPGRGFRYSNRTSQMNEFIESAV